MKCRKMKHAVRMRRRVHAVGIKPVVASARPLFFVTSVRRTGEGRVAAALHAHVSCVTALTFLV